MDALKQRSFQVAQHSNSNYNGTSFSVLSLFNMGYIEDITKAEIASAIAYSKSVEAIKKNDLMHFFYSSGYNIYNHSFFEVEQTKSLNYLFLPVKQRLMLDKTFGNVLLNDLLCSINSNDFHLLVNDYPARIDRYNQEVIKRSYETININVSPVFMYAHFMMPHSPFLRDSTGKLKNIGEAYKESNKGLNIESYLQYLNYCNTVSLKIIDSIKSKKPNAVIVVMSDHGLRNLKQGHRMHSEFNNFIAISPPQESSMVIPDSLCTVNVFRLIMNQHFGQNFPMLSNRKINVNMALIE
jgi:Sulfatase